MDFAEKSFENPLQSCFRMEGGKETLPLKPF